MIRYRLRTPVSYWLLGLLLLVPCGFALYAAARSHDHRLWMFALAITVGAPLLVLLTTAPYRAWPGAAVELTVDRLIVKRGFTAHELTRDGLVVMVRQVNVQLKLALVPVGTMDRGQIVTIAQGSHAVRFSTLLVAYAERAALLGDLDRFLRGEPPQGPRPAETPRPPPASAAERDLDDELARLD